MDKKRVVITGMGAITGYGIGVEKFWNGIKNCESCITLNDGTELDLNSQTTHIFGAVPKYDETQYMDAKESKRLDNFIKFALVASDEAFKDSGLDMSKEDPYRVGCLVSSAAGGFRTIEVNHEKMLKMGYTKCSPFTIPAMIANMAAGKVAIRFGLKGINKAIVSACASGTHSIGDAFRTIQYGEADAMLAGGTESVVCNLGVGGFSSARTLSKRNDEPTKASRPYDVDRDGFVMSEGAGVLVLEELEHAQKFYDYINRRDGRAKLAGIDESELKLTEDSDTNNILLPFYDSLKHEQQVSTWIYQIADKAQELKDHATYNFILWFCDEQVDEELKQIALERQYEDTAYFPNSTVNQNKNINEGEKNAEGEE